MKLFTDVIQMSPWSKAITDISHPSGKATNDLKLKQMYVRVQSGRQKQASTPDSNI